MNQKIWFRAKRYGWGWGLPTCWQGWLALALYVALAAGGAAEFRDAAFVIYMAAISAGMILVCWLKGEKPRWRWGGDD